MNWRLVVLLPLLAHSLATAFGHDHEKMDAYGDWFVSQLQEDGSTKCCGDIDVRGGDAHYVDVKTLDNQYHVFIDSAWVLYPRRVSPYLMNPTGRNVLWFKKDRKGDYVFYCLRLANGT